MAQPPTSATSVTYRGLLRNRDFRLLWSAFAVSSLGGLVAAYTLLVLMGFKQRVGTEHLSLLAALFFLSQVVVLPFAGVILDRVSPVRLLTVSELSRAGLLLVPMVSASSGVLTATILLFGLAGSFFFIVRLFMTRRIVSHHELTAANALITQAMQMSLVIAPGLSGLLLEKLNYALVLSCLSVSFLISAVSVSGIRLRGSCQSGGFRATPTNFSLREIWALFAEGIRFGVTHRQIRYVIVSLSLTLLVTGSLTVLGVIYVRDVLGQGPQTFGLIVSLAGAGTLIAVPVVGKLARVPRRLALAGGIFSIGGGLILLTFVGSLTKIFVCAFVMGMAAAAIIISAQTLLQEETPMELMGRVTSASWACFLVAQTLSLSLAGVVAGVVGIKGLYRGAGLLLATVALIGFAPYLLSWHRSWFLKATERS